MYNRIRSSRPRITNFGNRKKIDSDQLAGQSLQKLEHQTKLLMSSLALYSGDARFRGAVDLQSGLILSNSGTLEFRSSAGYTTTFRAPPGLTSDTVVTLPVLTEDDSLISNSDFQQQAYKGDWSSSTNYLSGNKVTFLSEYYVALQSSLNQDPSGINSLYWKPITSIPIFTGDVVNNRNSFTVNSLGSGAVTTQELLENLDLTADNSLRLGNLETRVTTDEGFITVLQGQTAALATRSTDLEFRATDLEDRTTDVEDRTWVLEGTALSLASRATAVEGRSTLLEGRSTVLESRAADLESRATTVESRATVLESRATTVESRATVLESRASTVESRATVLESRATVVEGRATVLETRASGLETREYKGIYDAGTSYLAGNKVTYQSEYYVSLQNTINNLPSETGSLYWSPITSIPVFAGDASNSSNIFTVHSLGDGAVNTQQLLDTISGLGTAEIDITALQNRATVDEGLITALQDRATTDEGLITALQDRSLALETREFKEFWSPSSSYLVGNKVSHDSRLFVAVQSNTNQNPLTQPSFWTPITGLPALSGDVSSSSSKVVVSSLGDGLISVAQLSSSLVQVSDSALAITTLQNRATEIETVNTAQNGSISTVEGRATVLEGRTDTLESRALAIEGVNTTQTGQISALADRSTSLEGRATAIEGVNTTQTGQISALADRSTSLEGRATVVEDRASSLETRTTAVEGVNSSQAVEISTIQSVNTQQQTSIAALNTAATANALAFRTNSLENSSGTKLDIASASGTSVTEVNIANSSDVNQVVNIATLGNKILNLGGDGTQVNIQGGLGVNSIQTESQTVQDKFITLNSGGAAGTSGEAGVRIREAGAVVAYAQLSSDRTTWDFKTESSVVMRIGQSLLTTSDVEFNNIMASGIISASLGFSSMEGSGYTMTNIAGTGTATLRPAPGSYMKDFYLPSSSPSDPNRFLTSDSDGYWSWTGIPATTVINLAGDLSGDSSSSTVSKIQGVAIGGVSSANESSKLVLRDSFGNFSAGTITANLTGNASTVTTAPALSGDVTSSGSSNATTVALVGGLSAASVAAGATLANSATVSSTSSALVRRDVNGDFAARFVTADLFGNASTVTTAPALSGDVTSSGASNVTTVTTVGGLSAASVAGGATLANAASSINTPSTLVRRDGNGDFSVSAVTATNLHLNTGAQVHGHILQYQTSPAIKSEWVNPAALPVGTVGGDVSGNLGTLTVNSVGGSSSSAISSGVLAANNATSSNVGDRLVKRNVDGDFSARNITADLYGTSTTCIRVPTLSGDVTTSGLDNATTVVSVGGVLAAELASGAGTLADATSANSPSTLVKRDGSGGFSAGTISAGSLNSSSHISAAGNSAFLVSDTSTNYTLGAYVPSNGNWSLDALIGDIVARNSSAITTRSYRWTMDSNSTNFMINTDGTQTGKNFTWTMVPAFASIADNGKAVFFASINGAGGNMSLDISVNMEGANLRAVSRYQAVVSYDASESRTTWRQLVPLLHSEYGTYGYALWIRSGYDTHDFAIQRTSDSQPESGCVVNMSVTSKSTVVLTKTLNAAPITLSPAEGYFIGSNLLTSYNGGVSVQGALNLTGAATIGGALSSTGNVTTAQALQVKDGTGTFIVGVYAPGDGNYITDAKAGDICARNLDPASTRAFRWSMNSSTSQLVVKNTGVEASALTVAGAATVGDSLTVAGPISVTSNQQLIMGGISVVARDAGTGNTTMTTNAGHIYLNPAGQIFLNGGQVNVANTLSVTGSTTLGNMSVYSTTVNLAGDANHLVFAEFNGATFTIEIDITSDAPNFSTVKRYKLVLAYTGSTLGWQRVLPFDTATVAGNDYDLDISRDATTGISKFRIRRTAGPNGGSTKIVMRVVGNSVYSAVSYTDTTAEVVSVVGPTVEVLKLQRTADENGSSTLTLGNRTGHWGMQLDTTETNGSNWVSDFKLLNSGVSTVLRHETRGVAFYGQGNTGAEFQVMVNSGLPIFTIGAVSMRYQSTREATSTTDASAVFDGGLAVAMKAIVGTDLTVGGSALVTGALNFPATTDRKKVVLYNGSATEDFYGFGIEAGALRYQIPNGQNHRWYASNSGDPNSSTQMMALDGSGNLTTTGSITSNSVVSGSNLYASGSVATAVTQLLNHSGSWIIGAYAPGAGNYITDALAGDICARNLDAAGSRAFRWSTDSSTSQLVVKSSGVEARALSVSSTGSALTGTTVSNVFRTNSGALSSTLNEAISLGTFGFASSGNNVHLGIRAKRTSVGSDWLSSSIVLSMDVDDSVNAGTSIIISSTSITMPSITEATSLTEAALVLGGGLAVAKKLRVGGSATFDGDLTVTGALNAPGISSPTTLTLATAGGIATPLNYYEEYDHASTFDGTFGLTSSRVVKFIRIGKIVTMLMPGVQQAFVSPNKIFMTTSIPSRFQPLADYVPLIHHGGGRDGVLCNVAVVINNSGVVNVWKDVYEANFTGGGDNVSGFYAFSITWCTA